MARYSIAMPSVKQASYTRLEQVQYRVLKGMAATNENVAAALLNMEFGCRT